MQPEIYGPVRYVYQETEEDIEVISIKSKRFLIYQGLPKNIGRYTKEISV